MNLIHYYRIALPISLSGFCPGYFWQKALSSRKKKPVRLPKAGRTFPRAVPAALERGA
jgi:hypothetical protein